MSHPSQSNTANSFGIFEYSIKEKRFNVSSEWLDIFGIEGVAGNLPLADVLEKIACEDLVKFKAFLSPDNSIHLSVPIRIINEGIPDRQVFFTQQLFHSKGKKRNTITGIVTEYPPSEKLGNKTNQLENTRNELKNTQEQLIQSEKMASLGALVAGIAHEINNPINFINSSSIGLANNLPYLKELIKLHQIKNEENYDLVVEEIKKKEEFISLIELLAFFEKAIGHINIGVDRTTKIVKGLKSFARSDESALSRVDIHQNIENTLIILQNQIKYKIKIERDFCELPKIECYAGLINQVLMNILSNAIQAIEEKGIITISTGKIDDNEIFVSINDTGNGMDKECMNRVFDPFFTTKEAGKGTGLGLSIAYKNIDKHNGKIFVESKVQEGSTFTIKLPINQR